MGRLALWLPLDGDPEELATLLAQEASVWLPGDPTPRGPGHWGIEIAAGPIRRAGTCMVGDVLAGGGALRRRVSWSVDREDDPELGRALPSFDGDIELRDVDSRAELHLDGVWSSPEGTIGAAMSPAQLAALAEEMGRNFLGGVLERIHPEEKDATARGGASAS